MVHGKPPLVVIFLMSKKSHQVVGKELTAFYKIDDGHRHTENTKSHNLDRPFELLDHRCILRAHTYKG